MQAVAKSMTMTAQQVVKDEYGAEVSVNHLSLLTCIYLNKYIEHSPQAQSHIHHKLFFFLFCKGFSIIWCQSPGYGQREHNSPRLPPRRSILFKGKGNCYCLLQDQDFTLYRLYMDNDLPLFFLLT